MQFDGTCGELPPATGGRSGAGQGGTFTKAEGKDRQPCVGQEECSRWAGGAGRSGKGTSKSKSVRAHSSWRPGAEGSGGASARSSAAGKGHGVVCGDLCDDFSMILVDVCEEVGGTRSSGMKNQI